MKVQDFFSRPRSLYIVKKKNFFHDTPSPLHELVTTSQDNKPQDNFLYLSFLFFVVFYLLILRECDFETPSSRFFSHRFPSYFFLFGFYLHLHGPKKGGGVLYFFGRRPLLSTISTNQVVLHRRRLVSLAPKKKILIFLFPLLSDPYRLLLLTGHSVTESSTRVRKDGDDVQQDTSGVVHDFMEPTLLAIPAHLKIDVSFFKLIAPLY